MKLRHCPICGGHLVTQSEALGIVDLACACGRTWQTEVGLSASTGLPELRVRLVLYQGELAGPWTETWLPGDWVRPLFGAVAW